MSWILVLLLVTGVKVPEAEQFVGAPQGQPVSGAQLEQRTGETAALLRCPVCQGMAVADSPSEMAVNMKHQVRELTARGYTQEQILQYFERSYGQFVLLRPKFQGVNALVWILPVVALLVGVAVIFVFLSKRQPVDETAPADDPYLAEVRKLTGKQS